MSAIINGFVEDEGVQRLLFTLIFPYWNDENQMVVPLAMEMVYHPIMDDIEAWCDVSQIEEVGTIISAFISDDLRLSQKRMLYDVAPFEIKCIILTAIFRHLKVNPDILEIWTSMYDKQLIEAKTSAESIEIAESMKMNGELATIIKGADLFAENYTNLYTKRDDGGINYGSALKSADFSLNIGVEKSRIKTLRRQRELREAREKIREQEQELLEALKEAAPVKVSKQSQTKQANKKKEQQKKEKEEYEKRVAEAEAERLRQQKKKQQQKQQKKGK